MLFVCSHYRVFSLPCVLITMLKGSWCFLQRLCQSGLGLEFLEFADPLASFGGTDFGDVDASFGVCPDAVCST